MSEPHAPIRRGYSQSQWLLRKRILAVLNLVALGAFVAAKPDAVAIVPGAIFIGTLIYVSVPSPDDIDRNVPESDRTKAALSQLLKVWLLGPLAMLMIAVCTVLFLDGRTVAGAACFALGAPLVVWVVAIARVNKRD